MTLELRTLFARLLVAAVAWLPFGSEAGSHATNSARAFVHPGLLHARTDFKRMKQMVAQGAEPWKSGYEKLRTHQQSRADWRLRGPFAEVVRDSRGSRRIAELETDSNAAY